MAQHPFAAKAREELIANGVTFNTDGTTQVMVDPNGKRTDPPAPAQPATQQQEQPPAGPPAQPSGTDDVNKLLELQRQELERLRAEEAKWKAQPPSQPQKSEREIELENQLAELRGQLTTQQQQEQDDELRSILERQGFDAETLDDDVLAEIRDTFIKPVAGKIERLEQRLKATEERFRDPTPEEKLTEIKNTTMASVKSQLKDFDTVFKSEAFQQRLLQKDSRFPTKTYGEAMQMAYESGDADFIVREVQHFLNGGSGADISSIADVGATNGVGTTPAGGGNANSPKFTFSNEEIAQMLYKVRNREITKEQYSDYMAKARAAKAQ